MLLLGDVLAVLVLVLSLRMQLLLRGPGAGLLMAARAPGAQQPPLPSARAVLMAPVAWAALPSGPQLPRPLARPCVTGEC